VPAAGAAAVPAASAAPATASGAPQTAAERALAMQKSIAARLAAAKIKPAVAATTPAVKLEAAVSSLGVPAAAVLPSVSTGAPPAQFASPSVTVKDERSWMPLRLDAQGRQIDEQGRLVQLTRPTELKVNARAVAEAQAAANAKPMPRPKIATTLIKDEGMSKFHDPRMAGIKPAERKPRALALVQPGKYVAMAATMRMKQLEKDMQDASRAAKAALGSAPAAAVPVVPTIVKPGPIPDVEWWDAKLLSDPASYESEPSLARVTSYIYHPIELSSLTSAPAPPPMPVLLTKKERKKIKKRNKRELLKEKQDRVRAGLEAPAEPKMRLSNLMNVLLNDTVADPSAMEAKVRAQMAERVSTHLEANAARKLTPEQKAEKRRRKYHEDTSAEVHVAVYRAGELADGKARYQIDVNAQQWNLSGVAVLHPECNVVVVEGGPKAQRRFRRLMLHRIRWKKKQKSAMEQAAAAAEGEEEEEEESDSDDSDDEDGAGHGADANATRSRTGACALVWSGVVPTARFLPARFTFEAMRSEALARNHLAKLGMESYWDMCRAYRADTDL